MRPAHTKQEPLAAPSLRPLFGLGTQVQPFWLPCGSRSQLQWDSTSSPQHRQRGCLLHNCLITPYSQHFPSSYRHGSSAQELSIHPPSLICENMTKCKPHPPPQALNKQFIFRPWSQSKVVCNRKQSPQLCFQGCSHHSVT